MEGSGVRKATAEIQGRLGKILLFVWEAVRGICDTMGHQLKLHRVQVTIRGDWLRRAYRTMTYYLKDRKKEKLNAKFDCYLLGINQLH